MWEQEESGRVRHPFEPIVLATTLALIPVLIIENDAKSDAWQTFAVVANWLIWVVFAAELTLILAVAQRKGAALRAHWLDAAVVFVTIPFYGQLLSSLRLVRLVRLLRVLRTGVLLGRTLQAERRISSGESFRYIALATVLLVVVAGAAQATVNEGEFATLWDGVWWAFVTVTTVGYGDLYPSTVPGRLIGIALMLMGIAFLAVLTGTIASHFVRTDSDPQRDEIIASLQRIEADIAELKAR